MNFRHLILWLSILCADVHALSQSFPYEVMYFYEAYKLEWLTTPDKANRQIATGCQHKANGSPAGKAFEAAAEAAGLAGICSIDEFVKEIGLKTSFGRTWKYTENLRVLVADGSVLSTKMRALNKKLLYWPSKLFPGETTFPSGKGGHDILKVPLPKLQNKILDSIQTSRQKAAAAGKNVDDALGRSKQYLRMVHQLRMADQSKYIIPALKNSPAGLVFKDYFPNPDKTVTILDENGNTLTWTDSSNVQHTSYTEVDIEQTIANAGDKVNEDQKAALRSFGENYGTSDVTDADKTTKDHMDVIRYTKFSTDLVSSTNLACPAPVKKRMKRGGNVRRR